MKTGNMPPENNHWRKRGLGICSSMLFLVTLFAKLTVASADTGQGFQVNRYEPTPAGEWSFMVDHPWYQGQDKGRPWNPTNRYFSGGITLDYAHNPLVFGSVNKDGNFEVAPNGNVIEHLLMGHVDLAISFAKRVNISLTLPITLLERGDTTNSAATGVTLTDTVAVGDPRLGISVRLYGNPYADPFSISIGAYLWFPFADISGNVPFNAQENEHGWRVMPQLILGGLKHHVKWSIVGRYLYRPDATIGSSNLENNKAGMEVQAGFALAYADTKHGISIGAEALGSTMVSNGDPFQPGTTSLEVLPVAFYWNMGHQVNLGLAGGIGIARQPGTPDGRAILRLAYAPMARRDRDKDGVFDDEDNCPTVPGPRENKGCPWPDRDRDGVFDNVDQCPDMPGPKENQGCPWPDRDGDGVPDKDDLCPDVPKGPNPDPDRLGCPLSDRDGDGVWDKEDLCPDVPKGPNPDPDRLGCPLSDRDGDGVWDKDDLCPDVPAGPKPDPDRLGCPLKEAPPKKAVLEKKQIRILDRIYFDTNKHDIKPPFDVLFDVMRVLNSNPEVAHVRIEAYADYRGNAKHNKQLSNERAQAVLEFLTKEQTDPADPGKKIAAIDPARLSSIGCGKIELTPALKKLSKKLRDGVLKDRRVVFILEGEECAGLKETQSPSDVSPNP